METAAGLDPEDVTPVASAVSPRAPAAWAGTEEARMARRARTCAAQRVGNETPIVHTRCARA